MKPPPRRTRSTLAALAGCSALLLAGCGASSPTKAQYTANANAICRTTGTQTAPLVEQLTTAVASLSSSGQAAAGELASALTQLHAAAAGALAKLRALKQPAADGTAIRLFLASSATVDDALAGAAKAAAAGNPQLALAQLERAAPAAQQTVSAARAYGMAACENVLSVLGSAAFAHPVEVSIVGENHEPTVSRPWRYTITVTDAQGHRLSGTETTQYTYNGVVVGTEKPQNVTFANGVYHDTVEFPAVAVGYPLDIQAVIHTSLGTATVDWPVKVRR
jgi:hypothetical protein